MTTCELVVWAALVAAAVALFLALPCRVSKDDRPTYPASPLGIGERQGRWVELLKLEYEKAADRYENIYRAIWQNFSYMAVVAGGVLTFGAQELGVGPILYFLALTPLFFWLVATFLPLNHYGQAIRDRLRDIEGDINRIYFPEASDPRLEHFKLFGVTRYKWRVQTAVGLFGIVIAVFWLRFGVLSVSQFIRDREVRGVLKQTLHLEAQPLRVEVEDPEVPALRDSISALSGKITSIDSLLRIHSAPVPKRATTGGTTHQ